LSNLEGHFYKIANEQFTEGMKTADRLLDLVRGAALIDVYLYSHARYHEVGAANLALSSGILTSVLHVAGTGVMRSLR
jgi:hypothetical protein